MIENLLLKFLGGVILTLVIWTPILIMFKFGNQVAKYIFIKSLANPNKVKIKNKLFIRIVHDGPALNVIEKVLISKKLNIITDQIVRSMYSISPFIAKIYTKHIGEPSEIAINNVRTEYSKYLENIEKEELDRELKRFGVK